MKPGPRPPLSLYDWHQARVLSLSKIKAPAKRTVHSKKQRLKIKKQFIDIIDLELVRCIRVWPDFSIGENPYAYYTNGTPQTKFVVLMGSERL